MKYSSVGGFFFFTNMPEENTDNAQAQTTSDETVQNTGANDSGAATDTASATQANQATQNTQSTTDITKTPEFKNALTKAITEKIPQLKRQIAKDLTGEGDGLPTVEDLQRQLKDTQEKARTFETKEAIRDFLADTKNKTQARPENMRAIEKLVLAEIQYDDGGEISNLKEAIERVKSEAPTLFTTTTTQINGNTGKNQPNAVDFNTIMRRDAGFQV